MKTKLIQSLGGLMLLMILSSTMPLRAAVSVYGIASSSGEFVTARAYAIITTTPIVSFSTRVFYDPEILYVASASRNDAVWRLFDGFRTVDYMEPDTSTPGQVLMVGAHLEAGDPQGGVLGNGVLLGTVVFGRHRPKTPEFSLKIGRTGAYASFVTTSGVTLEALPGEVVFSGVAPIREDQDLDGLQDLWEIEHFRDIRAAFYSDDPDRDGANNLAEEALGSDPNDSRSNLSLTLVRREEMLRLEWNSFEKRTYAVESSEDLLNFKRLATGLRATPPVNVYEFRMPAGSKATFYRILLEQ